MDDRVADDSEPAGDDALDERLVIARLQGRSDPERGTAFEELVRLFTPRLDARLIQWGLAYPEREEVLNSTWMRVWEKVRSFEDRGFGFWPWLVRVAAFVRHETERAYARGDRLALRNVAVDELPAEDLLEPIEDAIERASQIEEVRAVLREAPEDYQNSIEAMMADLTGTETQELYGWSRSKTDTTRFRALAWLREQFVKGGDATPGQGNGAETKADAPPPGGIL